MPRKVRERQVTFKEDWDGDYLRLQASFRGTVFTIQDNCNNIQHFRFMKRILMNEINRKEGVGGPNDMVDIGYLGLDI